MRPDLTDAELDELGDLLAATPAPLEPLDVPMLDGYLCGVLVQPRLIGADEWLPPVFDLDGRPLPADADAGWLARCTVLVERRLAALNAGLAEDGWIDPVLVDLDREPPVSEYDPVQSPISRGLLPWVAGFHVALERFPGLTDWPDDAVALTLARLYRHLPADDDAPADEADDPIAALDRTEPLTTLEAATEDLVVAVADLWEMTREARFKVAPVRRDTPKVGRNDPCPCGSGRKYKQCHGQG